MALNNFWMATLTQNYGASVEPFLNNFFFTSVDVGAGAADLYEAFAAEDSLHEKILGIQNANMHSRNLRVINLGSLTDFFDNPLSGDGAVTAGEMLPPHDVVNFTLKLNTRAVKPGSKRFSGLSESMVASGAITDSGLILAIGTLEIALADVIAGDTTLYTPVVVKRVRIEPDEDHPAVSYRLPETDEELQYGLVTAALVSLKVSHQVSRGNGR